MSDNNVASGCVNVFNSFFLIVIEGILTYRFPILESEEYGKMYDNMAIIENNTFTSHSGHWHTDTI